MRRFVVLLFLLCPVLSADTVLVLPFFNLSRAANLDWIGESIGETVRVNLASQGVLALDRTDRQDAYHRLSIRPYVQLTHASVMKLGETVDADEVVFGSFDYAPPQGDAPRTKGTVRITSQVVDLKNLRRSPEFSETGSLEDLARLQTHLSWQVLRYVAPQSSSSEEVFFRQHPPVRVEAMENYTRGLLATNAEQKQNLLLQATRLDPKFSQPYIALGRWNRSRKNYRAAADWFQKVAEDDPQFRQAHFEMGLCLYFAGDYAGAARAFQVVAQVVPLNEVLNDLGVAQARAGQPGALETLRRALEGDPNDATYHFNVGYELWKQKQFNPAIERFQSVLARNPEDEQARMLLERCRAGDGPNRTDPKTANLERLKQQYEETAYWQLKAMLEQKK